MTEGVVLIGKQTSINSGEVSTAPVVTVYWHRCSILDGVPAPDSYTHDTTHDHDAQLAKMRSEIESVVTTYHGANEQQLGTL